MTKVVRLIFLIIIFPKVSLAQLSFSDAVFPELVTSARALAMGNAYICKVDDSHSAFYNPAGLGTVRFGHFHPFNFSAEVNRDYFNSVLDGRFSDVASNLTKGFSLDGIREVLKDKRYRDKVVQNRFQTMPNILFRYFTAGFFISKRSKGRIQAGDDTTASEDQPFEYATRTDFGPYAAMNISLFGGVLKFGATGMILSRHEASGTAPQADTFELEDDDYLKGTREYVIGGARLTLPIALLPTFAATLHNATNSNFKGRGAGAPEKIEQTVDVGFSITPQIGRVVRLHLEANYKDIGNTHRDVQAQRKLVFGAEMDIGRKFFVRAGFGDGFGSGGLGFRSRSVEFDLTTYAVDRTENQFRGQEDRRFMLSLSHGF